MTEQTIMTLDECSLEDVTGVGPALAERLRDKFGSDKDALAAAYSIPSWLNVNIDGLGETTTGHLHEAAVALVEQRYQDSVRQPASDIEKLNTLRSRNSRFEIYEKYYYPVGFTTDNLALYYSGKYQGGSMSTQITRQTFTRDKVNSLTVGYWNEFNRDWKLIKKHTWKLSRVRGSPLGSSVASGGSDYIADVIDQLEWTALTDYGLLVYQRNRNYLLEAYPETITDGTYITDYLDDSEYSFSGELIGVTLDRIAVYWDNSARRNKAMPLVKTPDGRFYRVNGNSHMQTDDLSLYRGYNSPKALAIDLANTERKAQEIPQDNDKLKRFIR